MAKDSSQNRGGVRQKLEVTYLTVKILAVVVVSAALWTYLTGDRYELIKYENEVLRVHPETGSTEVLSEEDHSVPADLEWKPLTGD